MKKLFFSKLWSVLSLTVIALCSCIMGISALKNTTVLAATQPSFSVSNVQTSSYATAWGTSPLGVMFKDTNLPTVTGDTFLVRGTKTPDASASGGDYTPDASFTALAIDDGKISYTRADGQTGRLWRLGFTPDGYIHFLFDNFTGAEKGVILAGDTFTVADGFSFTYQDVVYTVTEGETYVYNGTAWAKEERVFSVSNVQTSSYAKQWGTSPLGVMFKDTNLPTVTRDTFLARGQKTPDASASGGDYTPAAEFTALAIDDEKISYTRADGQTGRLWKLGFTPDGYIHFLFDNFTDAEKGVILEGDTFTVADGFSFTYQDVVYTVTKGETYVYNGASWGGTLGAQKDVIVNSVKSSKYKNWDSSPLGVDLSGTNLTGIVTAPNVVVYLSPNIPQYIDQTKISFSRGSEKATLYRFIIDDQGIAFCFTGITGAVRGVHEVGDDFAIESGFSFIYNDVTYVLTKSIHYTFNGSQWINIGEGEQFENPEKLDTLWISEFSKTDTETSFSIETSGVLLSDQSTGLTQDYKRKITVNGKTLEQILAEDASAQVLILGGSIKVLYKTSSSKAYNLKLDGTDIIVIPSSIYVNPNSKVDKKYVYDALWETFVVVPDLSEVQEKVAALSISRVQTDTANSNLTQIFITCQVPLSWQTFEWVDGDAETVFKSNNMTKLYIAQMAQYGLLDSALDKVAVNGKTIREIIQYEKDNGNKNWKQLARLSFLGQQFNRCCAFSITFKSGCSAIIDPTKKNVITIKEGFISPNLQILDTDYEFTWSPYFSAWFIENTDEESQNNGNIENGDEVNDNTGCKAQMDFMFFALPIMLLIVGCCKLSKKYRGK